MAITPTGDRSGALAALGILAGPQVGEEVPIHSPVVSIGKGAQNDVVIPDDSVSTVHARLEFADGGWRLTDLNSTNGTYVESVKLAPEVPTPLLYGSAVRFGGARLQFREVEKADPESARETYAPPPRQETIRERKTGFRIPVWFVVLLLVLLLLLAVFFGWMSQEVVTPTPVPTPPPTPVGLMWEAAEVELTINVP